jgi:hypothetical protein
MDECPNVGFMLARRLLILIAVLMGLTALTAGLAPREPAEESRSTPTPTPAAPSAEPQPPEDSAAGDLAEPGVTQHVIDASEGARPKRVTATTGERLRITVEGDVLGSVELGDNVAIEQISPEAPASFELLPDKPGDYEITLVEADRRIGRLVIE